MIPLVDLKAQYATIKKEIDTAIQTVLNNTSFILGEHVEEFEKNFAKYNNAKHCVALKSGTAALHLALLALGIKPGDEVITISHTFIATTEAIIHSGAKPVFVDISPDTYLINTDQIEKAITPKTKAILPVDIYGQMADMKTLRKICDKHGLKLIEDAAQAHGAEQNNEKPGKYADVAAFSFYPGKNLGAYGDAGAIITNNNALAEKIAMLRDHGRRKGAKYEHEIVGYNERMDGLQGAVLNVKLKHLDAWINKRRKIAQQYNKGLNIQTPVEALGNKHAYHLYVVQHEKRDALLEHLKKKDIQAGIHYPISLHLQQAHKDLKIKSAYPATEKAAKRILSLPIYPEMTDEQIALVIKAVNEFK